MPNGTIRTNDLLDRETTNLYNLIVTANDCAKEFSIIYNNNRYNIEEYTRRSQHHHQHDGDVLDSPPPPSPPLQSNILQSNDYYSNKRNQNVNRSLTISDPNDYDMDAVPAMDIGHHHYQHHYHQEQVDDDVDRRRQLYYENHHTMKMEAENNFNTKSNRHHYHHQYIQNAKDQSDQSAAIYLKSRPRQKRQQNQPHRHQHQGFYESPLLAPRNMEVKYGSQQSLKSFEMPEKCFSTTTQVNFFFLNEI